MATVSVLNTTSNLSSKTLVTAENPYTISGLLSFSRGVSAPFAVVSGAGAVANLDADKLDGVELAALLQLSGGTMTGALIVAALRGTEETITATGTVNDLALGATTTILRCNNAALLTLNGMTGGAAGRILIVESVGAGNVEFAHQNAGSAAANRFINSATSGKTSLAAGSGRAIFYSDGTQLRWVLIYHNQGAWITPTFAAGDFTGSGSMTWTVAAGDVISMRYRLHGRTLSVVWDLSTTTVAGTLNSALIIGSGQWGGFTASTIVIGPALNNDAGGGFAIGVSQIATTSISNFKAALANWSTATDTTTVRGAITFEVD